jgi:COMPASS component SWD2
VGSTSLACSGEPRVELCLRSALTLAPSQGLLNVAGHPCVAYDPSGFVFAVGLNLRCTILLYDIKNFDKQPFLNIQINDPVLSDRAYPPRVPILTSLAFSNDGKWILVGTGGDVHYVVDSFDGHIVARLESESVRLGGSELRSEG